MNHVLIYLLHNKQDANFPKHSFDNLFKHIRTKSDTTNNLFTSKPFLKTSLLHHHKDLICHQTLDNFNNGEIKQYSNETVYRLSYQSVLSDKLNSELNCKPDWKNQVIAIGYEKIVCPVTAFPSTCKISEVEIQQRITFKINNRLYLNFVSITYESEKNTTYYNVYFNYQISENTDYDKNLEILNEYIKLLNE